MRVALVTPWFGRELIGGAERHAWELSHALAAAGADVDVLSTCCRSFNDDWATNFHRAGPTQLAERLRLLRFRVDSRDRVAFNRVTSALTALPEITLRGDYVPLEERDARVFVSENINSRELHQHVREHYDAYDAVLFMPYLYGTTLAILPQVAEKAYLIPCLHDEAYAYLDPVRACVARARGVLFNSLGEEETAAAIYGPGLYAKSRVVGEAVEPIAPPRSPIRIRGFTPHRSRYVLYLGRQVATKNIDFLITAYELFREQRAATSLQLVLAGPTSVSRNADGIVDLGPVNEDAKSALLTYARALAQPSLHESFSRAVYESWYAKRPVFVHGRCRATARAVEDSGGGWAGSTLEDWGRMFAEIDESADDAVDAVGRRGWAAALDNGGWDVVARRVLDAISSPSYAGPSIGVDQIVPLGERGATAYASAVGEALRASGFDVATTIAGTHTQRAGSRSIAHVTGPGQPETAAVYVAHTGDAALPPRHPAVFATSSAVAAGLEKRGIASRVLPMPVSPAVWDGARPAHQRWIERQPVLLSIAQLDAEHVRRVLDVFVAFLGSANRARLLLFDEDCNDEARAILVKERAELDLTNEVQFVGNTRDERYAAYRASSVAVAIGRSLDAVGAITPLWFDMPVVALGDPRTSELVDAAGLVEDRFDPRRFAALLRLVTTDEKLRAAMHGEGRRTRERYLSRTITGMLVAGLSGDASSALPSFQR